MNVQYNNTSENNRSEGGDDMKKDFYYRISSDKKYRFQLAIYIKQYTLYINNHIRTTSMVRVNTPV